MQQVGVKLYICNAVAQKMYNIKDHGQLFSWLSIIIPDVQLMWVMQGVSRAVNVSHSVLSKIHNL